MGDEGSVGRTSSRILMAKSEGVKLNNKRGRQRRKNFGTMEAMMERKRFMLKKRRRRCV
jgi:hypothetical protein